MVVVSDTEGEPGPSSGIPDHRTSSPVGVSYYTLLSTMGLVGGEIQTITLANTHTCIS